MTSNFVILHQAVDAQPSQVTQCELNSEMYTYVASAINIALSILEHPSGREALVSLAIDVDNHRDVGVRYRNDRNNARAHVNFFLTRMRSHFPLVVVNDTMTNLGMYGYHSRGSWTGPLDSFNPRQQSINLSGPKVRNMIQCARQPQRFRQFQFMMALTLVHEGGAHLLVTAMTNGDDLGTPPHVSGVGFGSEESGEAGRALETILFGGCVEFYRNPNEDDQQPGIAHIDSPFDLGTRAISPNAIADVTRGNFQFPLPLSATSIDRRTLECMGMMSNHPPASNIERHMMSQQVIYNLRAPSNSGYTVRTRDLWAIPTNPRTRLTAY
ncbi:hypothetical protein BGZ60DRAFT_259380 [Tricladium varicosporioides]|nr:hypothetical protein BGZ60DRAFT_259380 [Hymenoscyphus varicosporioides]